MAPILKCKEGVYYADYGFGEQPCEDQEWAAEEYARQVDAGFSTPEQRKTTEERVVHVGKKVIWVFAAILGIAMVIPVLPRVFPESPWAYALRYVTDGSRVQVDPRPRDCDWGHAPLGDKGCHYQKEISVARYSTDTKTGRPIVTYDDGKTWNWLSGEEKPGPVRVYVTWRKVPD